MKKEGIEGGNRERQAEREKRGRERKKRREGKGRRGRRDKGEGKEREKRGRRERREGKEREYTLNYIEIPGEIVVIDGMIGIKVGVVPKGTIKGLVASDSHNDRFYLPGGRIINECVPVH